MLTVRQKDIRSFRAVDITSANQERIDNIRRSSAGTLTVIATSYGVYGMNGCIAHDKRNDVYYKVTGRASALWYLM